MAENEKRQRQQLLLLLLLLVSQRPRGIAPGNDIAIAIAIAIDDVSLGIFNTRCICVCQMLSVDATSACATAQFHLYSSAPGSAPSDQLPVPVASCQFPVLSSQLQSNGPQCLLSMSLRYQLSTVAHDWTGHRHVIKRQTLHKQF
ncbi:hypothetical protein ACLKA6_011650 [Drosophila palustris]